MMQKTLTIIGLLALTVHGALGTNINLTNLPPFYVDDSKDQGCIKTVSNARSACPTCTSKGMPDWWVSEPYINLWVSDTPSAYQTSLGDQIQFRITYDQRDTRTNFDAQSLYNGAYYPTTGWNHNWWSYIHVSGTSGIFYDYLGKPHIGQDYSTWTAVVYTPGGGTEDYAHDQKIQSDGTQLSSVDGQDAHVVPAMGSGYTSPYWIPGGASINDYGFVGFRRVFPDGSQDIYGTPAVFYMNYHSADFLLTERIDAYGNSTHLYYSNYWDTVFSTFTFYVLQYVVDPGGKTNTFSYDSRGFLTNVAMPYGRHADMHYNDQGRLDSITDTMGMNTTFWYDSQTGFMTGMQTPYGVTSFTHTDLGSQQGGVEVGNAGGTNRVSRACLITLPDNSHELYAYRFDSSEVGIPTSYSGSQVPTGTPVGTLDTGDTNYILGPVFLRNSYHWDQKQFSLLSSGNVASLVSSNYAVATMKRWLVDSSTTNHLSETLSMVRNPSPDGLQEGQKTWIDYAGKTNTWLQGSSLQPGVAAMVLPGGNTSYDWQQYNNYGKPTTNISTYTQPNGSIGTRQYTTTYTNAIYAQDILQRVPEGATYDFGIHYWTNLILVQVQGPEGEHLMTISGLTNKTDIVVRLAINTNHIPSLTNTYFYTNTYPIFSPMVITDVSNNVTRLFFNNLGQLSGSKSRAGLTHTNLYATNGFLQKSIDLEIARTNIYAFTNGLVAAQTNELGLLTTYTWDALQRMTGIKYPDATTISNVYTLLDLTAQKDRLGNWSHAIYDSLRQMTHYVDNLGHPSILHYCACGSLESVTDPLQNSTTFMRDNAGRVTQAIYPNGAYRNFIRDSLGRVASVFDSSGLSFTNTYNNQGLRVKVTGVNGTLFQTSYSIQDTPDYIIDAQGVAVTNVFDKLHRVTTQSSINGTWSYLYSGPFRVATVDALQQTNWVGHDAAGRVQTLTNANCEITQVGYDPDSNVKYVMDGRSNKISSAYNIYGQNIAETNAAGVLIRTNGYDANGNLVTLWTKAKGITRFYPDANGNITNIAYPTYGPVTFTYDALNRPLTMSNEVGITTFGYTTFGAFKGAINSEAGPFNTVSYSYVNRLLSTLTATSWQQSFSYDLQNRLQGITSPAGSFNLGYNGPGQDIASIAGSGHTSAQTFDAVRNIKSTTLKDQFNNILDSYSYDYDSVGNRTNATRVDGSYVHYNYDKIGQLYKSVGFEQNGTPRLNEAFMYRYDSAGNLNSRSNFTLVLAFNVNNLNALTNVTRVRTPMYLGDPNGYTLIAAGHLSAPANSVTVNGQTADLYNDQTFAAIVPIVDGANSFTNTAVDKLGRPSTAIITRTLPLSITFSNDDNGNLLSDGVRSFVYDDANRLREVYVTNSWRSVYICDGLSRRSKRMDYNWQASAWNITNETHYVYAGAQVIQELNGNNIPVVSYTIGAGLLARTDANGSLYYNVDGNNNVTMLVNGQGTVMASYTYDPYGNIISKSGPMADANLYRFASQEINPTAGIYAYLLRFYDPNLQRWLTKDPIGLRGGRNVFAFVRNNPINYVDPLGLDVDSSAGLARIGSSVVSAVQDVLASLLTPLFLEPQSQQPNPPPFPYLSWAEVPPDQWPNGPPIQLAEPPTGDLLMLGLGITAPELMGLKSKPMCRTTLAAAKEGQQLFRVVNNAERAGIESSGKFTFPANGSTPTGQPGKFFWGSAEEAKQFQQIWYRGGEQSYILQTTIGSEVKPWLGPPLTDAVGQPIFVELPNLTAPIQWVH